jgi:hypothetical protein
LRISLSFFESSILDFRFRISDWGSFKYEV